MAWGGKVGRMSAKVRNHFLRHTHRRLPLRENPLGIPRSIMRRLSEEQLSSDPIAFNARLQELLAAHKHGG